MKKTEQSGNLYLGKIFKQREKKLSSELFKFDSKNLTTHAICVGMTGSGKTGLGIGLLEEVGLNGVPAIIIDPKGDLTNLLLTFPHLAPEDFLPWVDKEEAARNHQTEEQLAKQIATTWAEGLKQWDIPKERIQKLKDAVEMNIYTPASQAGISISILNSFKAPPKELREDSEAFRDLILSTTSSILGLIGIDADPIKSREHILISAILEKAWNENRDLDLPQIIKQIMNPPFDKLGVFDMETFFPSKERQTLSIQLNNLLASPSFQGWLRGEPLEIQSILYTKENKPKLSIFTISHLSDNERMFFVTLLLNQLLGWMRRQSGSSSLKAMLYMDEIFGFFPPTATPPSKRPMLTLLKQARAFGIGIVLATQNPVDLDYKGLSNCGTWFIGKLQTERDRKRVIDGLTLASNGEINGEQLSEWLASCGSRVFISRSIHAAEPQLFETRWTMSYLKGPLTLPQIEQLMKNKKKDGGVVQEASDYSKVKMEPPLGISEYYFYPKNHPSYSFHPELYANGKVHFIDAKRKVDIWQQVALSAPVDGNAPAWNESAPVSPNDVEKTPPTGAAFTDLPSLFMQQKNYAAFSKNFAEYLYQNQTLDLFEAPEMKQISKENETEEQFRSRLVSENKGKIDEEIRKIKDKYQSKIETLKERLERAKQKAEARKSKAYLQIWDTFLAFLTTVLGALLGKNKLTKGSINQAGTSLRKAGRITKEQQYASRAEESVEAIQNQLEDLETTMNDEVTQISANGDPQKINIEKVSLRPRKGDISIETVAILWCAH